MQKKDTITVDERVYRRSVIGQRRISHVIAKDLETAYEQMSQEEAREAEALQWAEISVGDGGDETR